jgi:DNA polymerase-3 subunit beta
MNFNRETLVNNLEIVKKFVPSKSTLSICECFKITTDKQINIYGTDLNKSIKLTYGKSEENISFVVNADLFLKAVKALKDEEIDLSILENNLIITAKKSKYKIALLNEDFPEFKKIKGESCILNSEEVKTVINRLLPLTGQDEFRPSMTGICFDKEKIVATSGHVLGKDLIDGNNLNFILPKIGLSMLDGEFTLTQNKHLINIYNSNLFRDISINVITIDETYVNYEAVIPKEFRGYSIFNRLNLLNALKRSILFSNESTKQIVFDLEKELKITAINFDKSIDSEESIDIIEGNNESIRIGFNAVFLIQALSGFECENITFSFETELKAAMFSETRDKLTIVMPVRLT